MSDGSVFAADSAHVSRAFRSIVKLTSIPEGVADQLESAFVAAHGSGDPRAERRCVAEHLAAVEWQWPWFEEWRGRFRDEGTEPYLWSSIRQDLDWRNRGGVDIRPHLLGHAISSRAFRLRDLATALRIGERRWPYLSVVAGCETEERIAREAWPAIAAGDIRILPPFFPGDRTGLLWLTERDLVRRPDLYSGWRTQPDAPVSGNALLDALSAD